MPEAPTVDGRWSYCRIFAVGPPCARLCGPCARTDRIMQAGEGRAAITRLVASVAQSVTQEDSEGAPA